MIFSISIYLCRIGSNSSVAVILSILWDGSNFTKFIRLSSTILNSSVREFDGVMSVIYESTRVHSSLGTIVVIGIDQLARGVILP